MHQTINDVGYVALGVESRLPMPDAKINNNKLKIKEELNNERRAVLYTSLLFSSLELKLKKVVSMP